MKSIRTRNAHGVHVTVKTPSLKYIDEFTMLKAAPDLLTLNIYPNAKEITESMAAFAGIRRYLNKITGERESAFGRKDVHVAVVGDGRTPRTGALFAFRTRWNVTSIDPLMKDKKWNVRNLTTIKKRVEDTELNIPEFDIPIIVAVHSHANPIAVLDHVFTDHFLRRTFLAIECCVPHDLPGILPDIVYEDYGIWSPQRTVKIWFNV